MSTSQDANGVAHRPTSRARRGQSLVEFAVILPLVLALLAGAAQLGVAFATKNALVQVARDTARWASTQTTYDPCSAAAVASPPEPLTRADEIATNGLPGYANGQWSSANFRSYPDNTPLPAQPPWTDGVEVVWSITSGTCPPRDNTSAAFVTVRVSREIPVFVPGMQYLPQFGTCGASGCQLSVWSTAQFRMEPPPQRP